MQHVPFAPWMRGADALALVRGAEGPTRSAAPLTYYSAILRVHERLSGEVWSAEAWVQLARTKLLAGDLFSAERALKQACMIGTPDPDATCMLAEILLETDRAWWAHELLTNLVRRKPRLLRARLLIGLARRELGRTDDVDAWREAIAIDPDCAIAWHRLGIDLIIRQDWEEAAAAFREALRLRPDNERAIFGLGLALNRTGDIPGGLGCVSRLREVGAEVQAEWLESCLRPAKPVPAGARLRAYGFRKAREGKGDS